jgi:hypothetical protein
MLNKVIVQLVRSKPPQVLLIYKTHLIMIVCKIAAANTLCKVVKKLLKIGIYSKAVKDLRNVTHTYTGCGKNGV